MSVVAVQSVEIVMKNGFQFAAGVVGLNKIQAH